jgi:hypothetical protein
VRNYPLSTTNAGMTRLRIKGKASPATLYDLLNGYVTLAGTIKPRPGTVVDTVLPAGTKGLVAHKGKLHVFSHVPTVMTDDRYVCITLRHPTDPTTALRAIHFAAPFMGFLYVVAAFEDGSQWHYWAEELDDWEAETAYSLGERVFPTVPNGFAYKATRIGSPDPVWAAGVERAVNDVIEPTVHNGFKYVCIAVTGAKPASGQYEPVWPTEAGATITEESLGGGGDAPLPIPGDDGDDDREGIIDDRYSNPGGSRP